MAAIAVLDDYQQVALQLADWQTVQQSNAVTVFSDHLDAGPALVERLQPFAVICAMRERTPFPRSLLEQLPALRLLVTAGMKNASIDLAAAAELGITVCGTGSPGHATAELTWGLILALFRRLPVEDHNMRQGLWQTAVGQDLHGKTLGILGLGRLGSQVAAVGQAFGMRVIAWSQNLTAEAAAEKGVARVEKAELLQQADVVTIHLRLSERTRHLLDSAEFAQMKSSAYLINTSRGPIVNEQALLTALHQGEIGGAGLDVFDHEPLPADHPLRSAPNTVLTPHLGFVTAETYEVFYGQMVEAISAFQQGQPIRVMTT